MKYAGMKTQILKEKEYLNHLTNTQYVLSLKD